MSFLLARYLPHILALVGVALLSIWLAFIINQRGELLIWQASVLSELAAQTSNPDQKGIVAPVRPEDAIQRIRLLAQNAATFEAGLVRCNEAAILYAESRDRAVQQATEAINKAKLAESAANEMIAGLLKEKMSGPGCEASGKARSAWKRLAP